MEWRDGVCIFTEILWLYLYMYKITNVYRSLSSQSDRDFGSNHDSDTFFKSVTMRADLTMAETVGMGERNRGMHHLHQLHLVMHLQPHTYQRHSFSGWVILRNIYLFSSALYDTK